MPSLTSCTAVLPRRQFLFPRDTQQCQIYTTNPQCLSTEPESHQDQMLQQQLLICKKKPYFPGWQNSFRHKDAALHQTHAVLGTQNAIQSELRLCICINCYPVGERAGRTLRYERHLLASSTACLRLYVRHSHFTTTTTIKQLITSHNLRQNFCLGEHLVVSPCPVSTQEVSSDYSGLYQFPTVIVVLINLEILELSFSHDRCIRVFLHKHHKDESSGWKPRTGSAWSRRGGTPHCQMSPALSAWRFSAR